LRQNQGWKKPLIGRPFLRKIHEKGRVVNFRPASNSAGPIPSDGYIDFKILNEAGRGEKDRGPDRRASGFVKEKNESFPRLAYLKSSPGGLSIKIERLLQRQKELEREVLSLQDRLSYQEISNLLPLVREVKGVKILSAKVGGKDAKRMRDFVDQLKMKIGSGIILLGSTSDDKVSLIMGVTPDLAQRFNAGNLVKKIALHIHGTGGVALILAQAGGTDPGKLEEALRALTTLFKP
jgi:alanyl-tRNA synthetase